MAEIAHIGGCKVAWSVHDSEESAEACAAQAKIDRERMAAQGYDFGYQWPGSIRHHEAHPAYGECWIVVIP